MAGFRGRLSEVNFGLSEVIGLLPLVRTVRISCAGRISVSLWWLACGRNRAERETLTLLDSLPHSYGFLQT